MPKKVERATPETLLEATRMGNLLMVHKILKHTPELVTAELDDIGNTALHIATQLSNESAVTILLAHKADRVLVNKENKSAVEIAYDAKNTSLLSLLTDAEVLKLRAKVVFAMLQKAQEEENARNAKMTKYDYFVAVVSTLCWLVIFFATFCCLWPETAQRLIGVENYNYLETETKAFLDKYFSIKNEDYEPNVDMSRLGDVPDVVREAIASGERERLARKAVREAAKAAGAGGAAAGMAAAAAKAGGGAGAPYGALHGEL